MSLNDTSGSLMISLFNIAFESRYTLFLLIAAGFMASGRHVQIELEINGGIHNGEDANLGNNQQ